MSNQIDPEETTQERAARVIDNASRHWKERNLKFETTLRNNVRDLSPYKRQVLAAWVKRMTEGIVLEIERTEVPDLGLDGLPDYDE
jgi:hypothetical protein